MKFKKPGSDALAAAFGLLSIVLLCLGGLYMTFYVFGWVGPVVVSAASVAIYALAAFLEGTYL